MTARSFEFVDALLALAEPAFQVLDRLVRGIEFILQQAECLCIGAASDIGLGRLKPGLKQDQLLVLGLHPLRQVFDFPILRVVERNVGIDERRQRSGQEETDQKSESFGQLEPDRLRLAARLHVQDDAPETCPAGAGPSAIGNFVELL